LTCWGGALVPRREVADELDVQIDTDFRNIRFHELEQQDGVD
jgi:hypothetical protein